MAATRPYAIRAGAAGTVLASGGFHLLRRHKVHRPHLGRTVLLARADRSIVTDECPALAVRDAALLSATGSVGRTRREHDEKQERDGSDCRPPCYGSADVHLLVRLTLGFSQPYAGAAAILWNKQDPRLRQRRF